MYGSIFRMNAKPGSEQQIVALMDEWERELRPNVEGAMGGYVLKPDETEKVGSVRTQGTGRIASFKTSRGAADVMPALPVRVDREKKVQNIPGLSDLLLPKL